MKVNNQHNSTPVIALLLLVTAVLACSSNDGRKKINNLIDEGNAASREGSKHVTEAEEKNEKLLEMVRTDWARLEEARVIAREAVALFDKAREKHKEASRKFDEARKLDDRDKFKEYMALKVKGFDKLAEASETAKNTLQGLVDNDSRSSFISLQKANNAKINLLNKETTELKAQADKIEKDNPELFK